MVLVGFSNDLQKFSVTMNVILQNFGINNKSTRIVINFKYCFFASKLFTETVRKGEMQVEYGNYCSQNKKSKFNFTSNQIAQFH